MWQISRMGMLGLLIWMAVEDVRYHRISRIMLIWAAVLGIEAQFCKPEMSGISVLVGLLVGGFFVGLSYITKEAIGYGDSILICILGMMTGAAELIEILMIAWCAAGIWAMVLLVRKHFARKTQLPFIPFLTLGYCVVWLESCV